MQGSPPHSYARSGNESGRNADDSFGGTDAAGSTAGSGGPHSGPGVQSGCISPRPVESFDQPRIRPAPLSLIIQLNSELSLNISDRSLICDRTTPGQNPDPVLLAVVLVP